MDLIALVLIQVALLLLLKQYWCSAIILLAVLAGQR
jgi:hypothetical protein